MENRRVKIQSKNYFNPKHEASFGDLGATKKKSGRITLFTVQNESLYLYIG